jgi:hypothetical protein
MGCVYFNKSTNPMELAMRFFISIFLAFAILSFALPSASAQDKTPVINKRQVRQKERIKEGVKSGQLTKGEAKYLKQEQKEIRASKRAAKADGRVSNGERKMIKAEQNKASSDIYNLKHNKKVKK